MTLVADTFVSNVELKVPVVIFAPTPAAYVAYAQPPPFWNATVMGTPVTLSLPGAPPMPPSHQAMAVRDEAAPSAPPFASLQPTMGVPLLNPYGGQDKEKSFSKKF